MTRGLERAIVCAALALAAVCLGARPALAQKQMEGGWCGAHGNFTRGYDCPRCSSGGGGTTRSPGGYTGPSFAELEAQRRAREQELARAKAEAERVRLRKEIADLDAALKVAREAAKRVRTDEEAARRAQRERGRAQALAEEVLRGVFDGGGRGPGPLEQDPLFSRGSQGSAPVHSRSKGILAGGTRPLEFLGLPGTHPAAPAAGPAMDRPARLAAIQALAKELGWSPEERTRLRTALQALALDGDLEATSQQIRAAWTAVHDPARQALATPGPVGAGTQTVHEDCTIFALANAAETSSWRRSDRPRTRARATRRSWPSSSSSCERGRWTRGAGCSPSSTTAAARGSTRCSPSATASAGTRWRSRPSCPHSRPRRGPGSC